MNRGEASPSLGFVSSHTQQHARTPPAQPVEARTDSHTPEHLAVAYCTCSASHSRAVPPPPRRRCPRRSSLSASVASFDFVQVRHRGEIIRQATLAARAPVSARAAASPAPSAMVRARLCLLPSFASLFPLTPLERSRPDAQSPRQKSGQSVSQTCNARKSASTLPPRSFPATFPRQRASSRAHAAREGDTR